MPYESMLKHIEGNDPKVKEICRTCGDYDSRENTWMMFAGGDVFACLPFHAVHVNLEKGMLFGEAFICMFIELCKGLTKQFVDF